MFLDAWTSCYCLLCTVWVNELGKWKRLGMPMRSNSIPKNVWAFLIYGTTQLVRGGALGASECPHRAAQALLNLPVYVCIA